MANVTALWSEDVTSRTTCHPFALSSRVELHAVRSTTLLRRRSLLYTSNVGVLPSFRMCSPQNRESRRDRYRVHHCVRCPTIRSKH
ncbi:hypothetical protein EVAR_65214_1 [Eumeta japonica]|uniref:Uncharacterized protein n=1 Tax=Eumeta variegata TaxID=151549 RepID=A0A4C2A833_EUMVA|nr:hypothetical protein EVAR_65214_1 [Eumeta japonica]